MIAVPPSGRSWKPAPCAFASPATAPETKVNLNGLAPFSAKLDAVSSIVSRPWRESEEVTWFHRSNITSFCVLAAIKDSFFNQNSMVIPSSKLIRRLDSLVPSRPDGDFPA